MDWVQVLTIAGFTIGAVWLMHREYLGLWRTSHAEMKDFHGRLCTLEEKYRLMMERYLENRKDNEK